VHRPDVPEKYFRKRPEDVEEEEREREKKRKANEAYKKIKEEARIRNEGKVVKAEGKPAWPFTWFESSEKWGA